MTLSHRLQRIDYATRIVGIAVVLAVLAMMVYALWPDAPRKTLTAEFPKAIGLYEGTDVRVLGVPIGTVDKVTPHGASVRVEMSYEAKYRIPANARAAIVAPSIVSDRYVQLTPVYKKGAVLADGAKLDLGKGAVPVELDRIYGSLDELSLALGPEGANKNGSLSRLLKTSAETLDGQGGKLHNTVKDVADGLGTLSDGRKDAFATVRQLQKLTKALAENDKEVRTFNSDLAKVAAQLSGERDDLSAALDQLALALADIHGFVKENRKALRSNVEGLTKLSKTLVKQQNALREVLENAPVGLANLDQAYNPISGTLDTRNNFAQLDDPAIFLCSLLEQLDQPDAACTELTKALKLLPKLPEIPGGPARSVPADEHDSTLGGILPKKGGTTR